MIKTVINTCIDGTGEEGEDGKGGGGGERASERGGGSTETSAAVATAGQQRGRTVIDGLGVLEVTTKAVLGDLKTKNRLIIANTVTWLVLIN